MTQPSPIEFAGDEPEERALKLVPLVPTQQMVDAAWNFAGGKHVTDAPDPYYAYRVMVSAAPSVAGNAEDQEDDPTAEELEAFRRKHWMHWNSAENLLIAHLVAKLRCAPKVTP